MTLAKGTIRPCVEVSEFDEVCASRRLARVLYDWCPFNFGEAQQAIILLTVFWKGQCRRHHGCPRERHLVPMRLTNTPLWLYFRSVSSSEKLVKLYPTPAFRFLLM